MRFSPIEWALAYYGAVSLCALVAYAWDKRASKRAGARRARERTLHLWALVGGFAGAWLGQIWLRHKTRHRSFAVVVLVAALLHAGAWIAWARAQGWPAGS